jgi:hypothetical protein
VLRPLNNGLEVNRTWFPACRAARVERRKAFVPDGTEGVARAIDLATILRRFRVSKFS